MHPRARCRAWALGVAFGKTWFRGASTDASCEFSAHGGSGGFRHRNAFHISLFCGLLPRIQKAYDLYLAKYKQRAAAYPQALIAQRTLFQLETDYVVALESAWRAVVELRGFLLADGLEQPFSLGRILGSQRTADE